MDPALTTPTGPDARRTIGWIMVAVILGEAIWNLIVSVMNNLVVPWLGDVLGSSSGLPTSFTQRPYDYPALFVSVLESCIAAMVAAILNYSLQQRRVGRARPVKSPVTIAPVEPVRIIPRAVAAERVAPAVATIAAPTPIPPPAPAQRPDPVPPSIPEKIIPVVASAPVEAPAFAPVPVATVSPAPPVAKQEAPKAPPPVPKAAPQSPPPKPKKSKPVYYNIVGEPMPSDED